MPPGKRPAPQNQPASVLVIRFSAMGDVILTRPVLLEFRRTYPLTKITLLSQELFRPLFVDIEGLTFIGADLKKKHKGLKGLRALSKELKKFQFDAVVDLHNVLRSVLVSIFLGLPVMRIDKGRKEKRGLTKRRHKILKPLKHTAQRYADVFAKVGFVLQTDFLEKISSPEKAPERKSGKTFKIGVAPLSRHPLKEWPTGKMKQLMKSIADDFRVEFFILGGGGEIDRLQEYRGKNVTIMAGSLNFADEIHFVAGLDMVITMDSANMHLAGILAIPCVSIWGPTHPWAGFGPIGSRSLLVQNSALDCRPCSVFGAKPCYRKDHACMEQLSAEEVYREVKPFITGCIGD